MEILKVHKSNAIFCELAMCALKNIITGRSDDVKKAVVNAGILPVLVEVHESHKANVTICDLMSISLRYLACVDSLNASIVSAGVVPTLAAIYKNQYGDMRSLAWGALDRLGYTENGPTSKPKFLLPPRRWS